MEARSGISLRHDDGRGAVAAPHVGHRPARLQLLLDAGQSRYPIVNQMRAVAGAEEALDADEEVGVVVSPQDAAALLKRFLDAWHRVRHRLDEIEAAADEGGALLVGERRGLFRRERELARRRVVLDVAARRLIDEPLAHVTLPRVRAFGPLRGRRSPGRGQSLVEPELLPYVDERRTERRSEVRDHLA